MKLLQLIFCVCYFFLVIGCSSESDKTTPDESIKENILEPHIKSLEKAAEVNTLLQNSTDNLRENIEKQTNTDNLSENIEKQTNTENLRENIEKQTDSEFVENSVEVVPWDIVPGKNWAKPRWKEENWPEDIESK